MLKLLHALQLVTIISGFNQFHHLQQTKRQMKRGLQADPSSDVTSQTALHQWLDRVKPQNSFVSRIQPDSDESLSPTSPKSALWLNVQSAVQKQQVWEFDASLGLKTGKSLCLHRWKIWWAIPKLLMSKECPEAQAPPETYFFLSQFQDGNYLLLLPVIDHNMGFTLEGSQSYAKEDESVINTEVIVLHGHDISEGDLGYNCDQSEAQRVTPGGYAESYGGSCQSRLEGGADRRALLVASGSNPFTLIEFSMRVVKRHMREQLVIQQNRLLSEEISADGDATSTISNPLRLNYGKPNPDLSMNKSKSARDNPSSRQRGIGPSFIDYFGWCTWDSFYTDLSTKRVLSGLKSFKATGVTPRFLILDDGWQGTNVDDVANTHQWAGRLTSFDANFKFAADYDCSVDDGTADVTNSDHTSTSSSSLAKDDENGNVCISSTRYFTDEKDMEDEKYKKDTTLLSRIIEQDIPGKYLPGSIGRNISSRHSLKDLITAAKEEYDIKHMLVWHTLSGYWGGVEVEVEVEVDTSSSETAYPSSHTASPLSPYKPMVTYPMLPSTLQRMSVANALDSEPFSTNGIGLVHPDIVDEFFMDYHRTLKSMGVDGVKVDAQSVLASLRGPRGGGYELVSAYHSALKRSVGRMFGTSSFTPSLSLPPILSPSPSSSESSGRATEGIKDVILPLLDQVVGPQEFPVIHCMCHAQGTLLAIAPLYDIDDPLNSVADESRMMPVIRGSDDFWPNDDASHGPHLYANAMNSLLMSRIGVHDWDMFQTNLGKPSAMHACARAISGGPVYVSDRPLEHESSLIRRLAFPDGSLPRCLRNARPTASSLFLDPQREAGVPLLLQNINPCGGLVIGAFSIAGAVLENDLEMFRWLDSHEMIWGNDELQQLAENYRVNHSNDEVSEGQSKEGKKARVPIYEMKEFSSALSVSWSVSPLDVEEILSAAQSDQTNAAEYIAHRLSDGCISNCDLLCTAVPIHLKSVFDYEVISFAEKYYFPGLRDVSEGVEVHGGDGGVWVAAVGAVNMLNPGGAVLSLHLEKRDVREIHIEMLGCGQYLILTNLMQPPLLSVISVRPLNDDARYGVTVILRTRAEQVLFQSTRQLVYSIIVDVTITPKERKEGEGDRRESESVKHPSQPGRRDVGDRGAAVVIGLQT